MVLAGSGRSDGRPFMPRWPRVRAAFVANSRHKEMVGNEW